MFRSNNQPEYSMDDWIKILSNQWYRPLSIHDITRIYCEINGLSWEYIVCSRVKLNKVFFCDNMSSMEQKCHQCYYVNLLIFEYISCNQQGRLVIDGTGSWSMKRKISLTGLIDFSNHDISNISNLYKSERKFELSISNEMWQKISDPESDHIFHIFQLHTWFIYIYFLYVVIIHLLRRGNHIGIYCKLIPDWIKSTRAQILFPAQYRAKL